MKRTLAVILAAAVLGACAPSFSLVEPVRRPIADVYTVDPQIAWSSMTKDRFEFWTVDGAGLEAIQFFNGIDDGDALYKSQVSRKKGPKFRKRMTASEIMEFVVDSMRVSGDGLVKATSLRPARFGDLRGFRFDLTFLRANGLEMQGLVVGTIAKEKLYLIMYRGAKEHYYPKYKEQVERMIDSIQTL